MAHLAPAGTPISLRTYLAAAARMPRSADTAERLAGALAQHSGHRSAWLTSTGRAGMVIALRALAKAANDPKRTDVVIPAYTCYSVAASVAKAGLRPRLCDIDPHTLSIDPEQLRRFDFSSVLAVVSANLYGLPNELSELEGLARARGVFMVDDAAQALGAHSKGRPVGGFGDIGLYSFDKGKSITSLDGGAVVTSDDAVIAELTRAYEDLAGANVLETLTAAAKLAVYAVMLRPTYYGVVRRLPFLGLGKTSYDLDYPIRRYDARLAGFAYELLGHLTELTRTRSANALALLAALRDVPGIALPVIASDASPSFTRLPILIRAPSDRARVLEALNRAGIGATGSYPEALCDVSDVRAVTPAADLECPGARYVAARIVTLPTHPYCPPTYAQLASAVIRAVPMENA